MRPQWCMGTIGAVSDFTERQQRELWARARRMLGEIEHLAPLIRENLDSGLPSGVDEYLRSPYILHVLDQATDLVTNAQSVMHDLERIHWIEEIP